MRIINIFFLITGLAFPAIAQQRLKINVSHRCVFSQNGQEGDLYAFPTNAQEVPALIADILKLAGNADQNFTLIQANVENVSAVVDSNGRYLLWNQELWEKSSPWERYAAFSHEIAHHIFLHHLKPEYALIEEKEADVFMGFILGMKNFSKQFLYEQLGAELVRLPLKSGPCPPVCSFNEQLEHTMTATPAGEYSRLKALSEGHDHSQQSLQVSALAFDNDPAWTAFQKAAFPFPPPPCYQPLELSREQYFRNCKTLGEVGKRITNAFHQKGYPYRFMSVPNPKGSPEGFAVVTALEQYEENGSMLNDPRLRWQELPKAENFAFSLDYLKSLFFPRRAHLRLFVVLVTEQGYASSGQQVTKDVAKNWIHQGMNRLPMTISQQPFSKGYTVDLLVYEFEVPETNHQPTQHCPCYIDAEIHLKRAGLGF